MLLSLFESAYVREKLTEVDLKFQAEKPERSTFSFPEGHKSCGVLGRPEPITFDQESEAFRRSSVGHFAQ